jgi:uncharacterized protein (DUF1800 family)
MADTARLAHVLRRLTFASNPGVIESLGETEPAELVEQLLAASPIEPAEPELGTDDDYGVLIRWWLDVMADPNAGVHERMVWFWHGHTTSSLDKAEPALMLRQHRLLRQHAMGNFRELLQAITVDGAMLEWLDGNYSQAWGPNENFAREVMELFALGRGNFTEADVRNGAYLFSGWYIDSENGNDVIFDPAQGPSEPRAFLGRTAMSAEAAIDVICDHEACAPFVAGQVYQYFIGRQPDDDVRADLATAFRDSRLDISTLVGAVLRHPTFLEERMNRPRTAVEFFLAAEGVLETRLDAWLLESMGQVPFRPPNVAGWPGVARWLSAGAVFSKVQLAYDNSWDTVTVEADDPVEAVLAKAALHEVSDATRAALESSIRSIESRRDRSTLLHALVVTSPEFSIA